MNDNEAVRTKWPVLMLGAILTLSNFSSVAQPFPTRVADEDVKSPGVRMKPGMMPKGSLLFNGWGITPAGEQAPISDMAVKFVISPDKKLLLAASAGYNDTGLTLFDIAGKRVTQFLPLPQVWNGLAFSKDGGRIFVSGGRGVIRWCPASMRTRSLPIARRAKPYACVAACGSTKAKTSSRSCNGSR